MSDENKTTTPTNSKTTIIPAKSLEELFISAEAGIVEKDVTEMVERIPVEGKTAQYKAPQEPSSTSVKSGNDPHLRADTTTDTTCLHEGTLPPQRGNCAVCHKIICFRCASPMDPANCRDCLSEESVTMTSRPLIDQDGVTHEGRLLIPNNGPSFTTHARAIADMADAELEEHISRYKALIKQAETALDFRRVSLGMAQVELGQRQEQQRRRLRAARVPGTKKTVSVSDPTKPPTPKPPTFNIAALTAAMQAITKARADKAAREAATAKPTQKETKP